EIKKAEDFIKAMDTLGRVVGLISQVVSLVAVPEVVLAGTAVASFAAMEERANLRSAGKVFPGKDFPVEFFEDTPPPEKEAVVASPVKNAVEEVLYGIELTPERLVITVATGGCTEKDSFHIHVDKGYTGLPPYQVTVYRIKPDDCKGNFEPIRISFSRKDLGLEGAIDFTVRNRIGSIDCCP
ncbi:MAG: hypothetical protein D3923_03235, partial [Candidatus Electrothrix sp. AR3]|nr:hypothetical protein [Candidatus Electrothrix sp. AR3]